MERRGMDSLSMACFLMMMFVGGECGRLDDFSNCYSARYSICALTNAHLYCAAKTLSECSYPQTASSRFAGSKVAAKGSAVKLHYCELGCALSRCSNISTQHLPKADQVAKCVNSCSEITCKSLNSNSKSGGNDQFCKLGCGKSVYGINKQETTEKTDSVCDYCTMACS